VGCEVKRTHSVPRSGLWRRVSGADRRPAPRESGTDSATPFARPALEQAARLNAMGEMAGVLAHELNQPLTAISAYVGAARRLMASGKLQAREVDDILARVADQSERAARVIARLRAYVTRGEIVTAPESLSAMFDEATAIALAGGRGAGLVLSAAVDPRADAVLADRLQVEQVMLNLIRNALEAMADAPRRELRVGARLAPGGQVEAYVADTGPGVPEDLSDRLFEPFVSGKPDGMGVGLSISRGVIEAHGGTIRAERNAEGGATFRFTLRRAPA
jgi:two-component system sensor kinase FixL